VNYAYKMLAAFAMIPLIYAMKSVMVRYLGTHRADELRAQAAH
jgi:hypothetical protein